MLNLQISYRRWGVMLAALGALVVGGCASGGGGILAPRPLIVPSGERLQPDSAQMDSVDLWVRDVRQVMEEDPSFWVISDAQPQAAYPWETLDIPSDDTVRVATEPGSDAGPTYGIYGFLHLMDRVGRMGEFFPDAEGLEGFELERFILARTAEAWILARSVYDHQPYAPMDEVAYALDRGHLDAMILHARPEEFAETREAWLEEHPDGLEDYRAWYEETFDREPPGRGDG